MFRKSCPMRAFHSECVAFALLALIAPAHAQTSDQNGQVTGPPKTLQQAEPDQASPATAPNTAPNNENAVVPAKPSVLGTGGEAAVEVGALGTVEGPPAGTLDDTNGGLGYAMWSGSDRAAMEAMLQEAQAASASLAARALLRRLLLTTAPPPTGPWHTPFTSLRIEKLLEAGMLDDAADLAARIQASTNEEIAHAQAEALLYAGRDADACGDATAYRLQSAEPFWIELRAYCYAVTNDTAALELTRSVMSAQEFQDEAFLALLGGMTGTKPKLPIVFASPSALHVRMLERLKLPLNGDIVQLGVPASLVAIRSTVTSANLRLAGADKALRAGALSSAQLSQMLALVKFKPKDLVGAAALAPAEPVIPGLARLRAALSAEKDAGKRTELIYTAFKIGVQQGLFAQVAALFAGDAAALQPSHDWSNWAPLMARGLLLAGKPDAAALWYDMMNQYLPQMTGAINELQLALALAEPNQARDAQAQASLSWLADQASARGATPEAQARAALYLGLFDAFSRPLSPPLQARVANALNSNLPGRRPPEVLMRRVDGAALNARRGEAVLAIIDAMGREGPVGLAPDVVVRLVRALQTLGLHDAAHMLGIEAVLVPAPAARG